jgi:hypothetical protein
MKRLDVTDQQKVIIVNASAVSRTFWKGEFDPNNTSRPTCWSVDTQAPSPNVPEEGRQATRCMDCPNDIRGSGSNGGRACRFSQKLAVVREDDLTDEEVCIQQLHVPANSIFGKGGKPPFMPLQEYAKFLAGHETSSVALVTKVMKVEEDVPRLLFAAHRPLEKSELEIVADLITAPDALNAINTDAYVGNEMVSPFDAIEEDTETTLENT